MATEITMPQMGFDMTEGVIANWLKAEGETVQKGEAIAEIETDKTTIQIEAFASGVLSKILAQTGAKVPVGETIGIISAPGEAPTAASAAKPAAAPAAQAARAEAPAAAPKVVNNAGVNATPVARRVADEHGIDLSQVKGTGPEGQVTKGDVEAFIEAKPPATDRGTAPAAPAAVAPAEPATGRIIATPVAKKVAQERCVDLRMVKGSGPEGRITLADVEA